MDIVSLTRLFCLSPFVLFAEVLLAQAPEIEWQRALGGSLDEFGLAMDLTGDGGYIVAGSALSSNGDVPGNYGGTDWWIVKLNATGTVEWSQHYGGSLNEQPNSIRSTSDGGFIAAGSSSSSNGDITLNQGLSDIWVVKLSPVGDIEWQRTYGGTLSETAFDIEETTDGGYVVVGEARSNDGDVSFNNGFTDCWLVKISSTGNLLWERSYGGSAGETGFSVRATSDGGFVIGAIASSSNGDVTDPLGLEDFWVIKTDAQGEIEWQRNYGGSNFETGCTVLPSQDGGYILGGNTVSTDGDIHVAFGLRDMWIARLSETGEIEWGNSFGGGAIDQMRRLWLHPSGDIFVAGFTDSNDGDVTSNNGDRDAWVLRVSSSGSLLWQKAMGGTGSEGFTEVLPTADNGYILIGSTTSNNGYVSGNNGGRDLWLVKLAPDPTSIVEFDLMRSHTVWPNPTNGFSLVDVSDYEGPSLDIRYYATNGACVREQWVHMPGAGSTPLSLDLSDLPQGLYNIILSDGIRKGVVTVVKE
jgi:hypothetical protein